ncbi:unnamed protein product [Paramecium pentaurelia]|uniref:Uncharacterized protein n=1 Tax=Paramecium pentaurelia TaxID=43138 RepID=A0A8S1VXF8_9CILI|nr:unnamed protein product [Paramecium pentaurelia]
MQLTQGSIQRTINLDIFREQLGISITSEKQQLSQIQKQHQLKRTITEDET